MGFVKMDYYIFGRRTSRRSLVSPIFPRPQSLAHHDNLQVWVRGNWVLGRHHSGTSVPPSFQHMGRRETSRLDLLRHCSLSRGPYLPPPRPISIGTDALRSQFAIMYSSNLVGNAIVVALIGVMMGCLYPITMHLCTKQIPRSLHSSALGFIAAFGQTGPYSPSLVPGRS